ncbi:MAG: Crp/Fnr family transcriptional regulator [Deltaproteobacteria bacterium]|nr:Crp/Fnr family transcriptional regulator [Deltaproteobacteria bacterium]
MHIPAFPSCPVGTQVALREACIGCTGRPATGQRQLERGNVLVMQGDPARHLFAVVHGWVRESVHDADGRALSARIVGPGRVLGLSALGAGERATHTATIEVLSPARVCIIPAERAATWFASEPRHAMDLALHAARALDDFRREMTLRAEPARERVLALIRELATQMRVGPEAWFRLPATREQIGEVLGLTLETVSRMLNRLARDGVIALRGREVRFISKPEDLPAAGSTRA